MNRLQYWMKAQTQYRVHSPFVFEMYRKVLFARVDAALLHRWENRLAPDLAVNARAAEKVCRRYVETVYKVCDHYHLHLLCLDCDEAVMEGELPDHVKVVCLPHRRRSRELRWMAQQGNDKYTVSIDLFDVGLLFHNPQMHRQHFLLK